MTINTDLSRAQYTGNGVTTAFTFASRVLADSHLRAIRTITATGATTELILNSGGADGFSVAGVGGVSCTVNVITAPTASQTLTIIRSIPFTQTADYVPNDPFPAETHEDALDKLTMIDQQQADEIGRSLKFPETSATSLVGLLPQTPTADAALVWDGTTGSVKNGPTTIDITNAAANATAAAASAASAAASASAAAPNANFTATTSGTNTYTCNTGATSRVVGQRYVIDFATANTNTTVTLNDNGLGAANIRYRTPTGLTAPAIGELFGFVFMVWDGTNYVIQSRHPFSKATDVAAAATTDFTTSVGDYVVLTGTTGITAMTLSDRDQKTVLYTGAGLSITLGASLTLNGLTAGTLTLQTNDTFTIRRDGTVTKILGGMRASGRPLSITGPEATIASASTTDLGTLASKLVSITGTVTITSLGSSASTLDPLYFIQFAGALTLTHNGTSLIIPGAANITTAAGDMAIVKYEGSGNWRVINYVKANGQSVASSGQFTLAFTSSDQTITAAGPLTLAHGLGVAPKIRTYELVCQTGEVGFSAGDIVDVSPNNNTQVERGFSQWSDTTNINIRYGTAASTFQTAHKTTGTQTALTNANWKLRVKAWA